MENFCISLDDEKISKPLCLAIFGGGAFNRFNNCIHRYGVVLVKDFLEEIEENILPFVKSVGFARWAFQEVKDLERLLKEVESNGLSIEMIITEPR